MKLLSVCVACYNIEQYLEKCLSSFADQRLSDFLEVIVVNDGSADNTADIADRYERDFPEIFKVIHKQNGGHGSAVNAAISAASGKYFRIVDGDDWVDTDNLLLELNALMGINSDLVIDRMQTVHMLTNAHTPSVFPCDIVFDTPLPLDLAYSTKRSSLFAMHTITIKTEILNSKNARLPEHTFYVDYIYILYCLAYSKTVTFLDLDIYRYLIGNAAQSVDFRNYVKRYEQHERVVLTCLEFLKGLDSDCAMQPFIAHSVRLLINTHYNILLIYDSDRSGGRTRAASFRKYLKSNYPIFYTRTRIRYIKAYLLNRLGVDYYKLQKIMGRS